MLRLLLVLTVFISAGCATFNSTQVDQADHQPIETQFDLMPELSSAELTEIESLSLDEIALEPMNRRTLQAEIKAIDAEISSKESQINHFDLLDDNIWKSQADTLRGEVANLRAQRAGLQSLLNQTTQ